MCVTRKRTATTATATEHRYARENFRKNMFYNIYKVAQKFVTATSMSYLCIVNENTPC